jgi:casein kinase II subunit beta
MNLYQEAIDLYGMIHARFIITQRGLDYMQQKFVNGVFGSCPRVLCQGQYVLPVGMSDSLRKSRVKVFCPLCEEVYSPKSKCKDIDGGYFGTSFPHVFLQNRPEASP